MSREVEPPRPVVVPHVGRDDEPAVRAAGVVPWCHRDGQLRVALVHRPRYDDWSWPKGKLDAGETWAGAAVREMLEETGWHARLGIPLPEARYQVGGREGPRHKVVRYWAAQVLAEDGLLVNEVDEVRWAEPAEARQLLTYRRDRAQLDAAAGADVRGVLSTWPLALVRHATTVPRRSWPDDDALRPLDRPGAACARDLVPLLSAYGVSRLLSSTSLRCTATLAPYARASGHEVALRRSLSEEGHADQPTDAARALVKTLARGEPAAVCSHRPVLPTLLRALAHRAAEPPVARALHESASVGFVKGEVLVAQVAGRGADATVVSVERHDVR